MSETYKTPPIERRPEVQTIHRGLIMESRQGVRCSVGVSEATCGASGISMQVVRIPPGGGCIPHLHRGAETALYILNGQAVTFYGPDLAQKTVTGPGEFLFIPPDVPHHARNLSATEPVIAIVAHTDANEQENVELYD